MFVEDNNILNNRNSGINFNKNNNNNNNRNNFFKNKENKNYDENDFFKINNHYSNTEKSFNLLSNSNKENPFQKKNNFEEKNLFKENKSNSFLNNSYNKWEDLKEDNNKNSIQNKIKSGASEVKNMMKNALSKTISNLPETLNKLSPFSKNDNYNDSYEESFLNEDNFNNNNNYKRNNRLSSRPSSTNLFGINTNKLSNSLIQPESQIDINEYNLSVCISNYDIKYIGTEEVILYQIDLYSNLSKKEWIIQRKLNEFYEMNLIFEKYYTKPPIFPGSGFQRLNEVNEINSKKEKLNIYIKEVINRPDLLTSIYCVKFLKLENHYPDIQLYYPLELYNLHDELVLPISCGYFLENANLLFVGCGIPNNNFLSGIFNKIKNNIPFLQKKNNENEQKKVLGQFIIFNIIKNYQGLIHFEVLYAKPTFSECTSINFYKDKNCLCLGMNDGNIFLYKIYINESTKESQGQFLIEAGKFNSHKTKIIGTVINFNNGYIYTIAKDFNIKIFDLNYQNLIKECLISTKILSYMIYDEKLGRIIIGDEGGNIFIIDIITNPINPQTIFSFQIPINNIITTINFNFDNEIMIIGTKGGKVYFYRIINYDIKNYNFNNKIESKKIKEMDISPLVDINKIIITERGEILFGLSNGSINVYYENDQIPNFVIDAHLKNIPNMFFEEERKALITLSEDKCIKMVQLPVYYPDQMLRNSKNDKFKKIDNSIQKLFGNNNGKNNNNNNNFDDIDYDDYYGDDNDKKEKNPFGNYNNNNYNNYNYNNNNNNDNDNDNENEENFNYCFSNIRQIKPPFFKNTNDKKKIKNRNDELNEDEIYSIDLDGWAFGLRYNDK